LIEEKEYNTSENCYYLTCVHKMHVSDGSGMELLEDFIKGQNPIIVFFIPTIETMM
jgi:hypothetical protein